MPNSRYSIGSIGSTFASPRYPSRFLLDIDDALLEYTRPRQEGLIAEARAYIAQTERFLPERLQTLAPGTRVRHAIFGPGTVQGVDQDRLAHLVLFDSMSTPRSISFKARLEPLES